MSTPSANPNLPEDPWTSVTWEGNEMLQLRRDKALSLREKIAAIEGMQEVAQRITQARRAAQQKK